MKGGLCSTGLGRAPVALAVTLVSALVCVFGPMPASAAETTAEVAKAAKKCKRAVVGGRKACLKVRQRCKKDLQSDYRAAGFNCRKGRLRRATLAQRRDGRPLLIGRNGQISLRTALAAFDETIAELPGVEARKGEIGRITDATFVVSRITSSLGKLTRAQRRAFTAATTPSADASVIPMGDEAAARARGTVASQPNRAASLRCLPPTSVIAEEQLARSALGDAKESLIRHGWRVPRPVKLCFLKDQGGEKNDILAFVTRADVPPGTSPTCNMFVTRTGRGKPDDFMQFVYAHELAHCSQNALFSSWAQARRAPQWVIEGGADWLASVIREEHADTDGYAVLAWPYWFDKPGRDLFTRTYDGLGFWAMLHQATQDGWTKLRAATVSAGSGGSASAYSTSLGGLPDIFFARWGPGYQMNPALGLAWFYANPSMPPVKPPQVKIANGTTRTFSIEKHAGMAARLQIAADVITFKPTGGTRGLLNFDDTERALGKGAFCAKPGGCRCATNTNLQLPRIGPTAFMGFGDAYKARAVKVAGHKLRDYCNKPTPGPESCPTGVSARGSSESCPQPSTGIDIYMGAEDPQVVASFKIGECTAGGGGFTAISTDSGWRMEVGISGFAGFGREYAIPYGGPDPLVVFEGPFGTLSNSTWQPGGLPNAGQIVFDSTGRHMGLGVIEFRNAGESAAILAVGNMTCVYPDD